MRPRHAPRVADVPNWLRGQAESARAAARAEENVHARAALRGKAVAFYQAENALRQAISNGRSE